MSEVPRRKWLQVHLSTAVVLMFVAGGIILGNVRLRAYHIYGWPSAAIWLDWPVPERKIDSLTGTMVPSIDIFKFTFKRIYDKQAICIDVAVALAILFAVWFVCEQWIRWRARRMKG